MWHNPSQKGRKTPLRTQNGVCSKHNMREEQQHEDAGLWRDRSIADLRNRSFSHDRVAERYRRQQSQGTLQRTRSKNQRLLTDPNLQDKLFEQDAPDTRLSTTQSFRSASGGGGGGGGGGIAGGATFRSTSGGGDGSGDGGALGNTTSRNSFSAGHRSSTFVARRPRHSAGGAGAGAGAGAGSPRSLQWPSPQRSQRSASVPTTASMQQLLDRCAEQKTVGSAAGILALEGVSTVGCVLRARWRVEVKGVAVSDAQAAGSVLRWWCDERELPQLRGQEEMPLTTEAVGCVVACTLSPSATVADHGAAVTVSGETVRAAAAHAVSRSDAAPTTPRQLLPSFRASDGPVRVGETIRLPSIDRTLLIEVCVRILFGLFLAHTHTHTHRTLLGTSAHLVGATARRRQRQPSPLRPPWRSSASSAPRASPSARSTSALPWRSA